MNDYGVRTASVVSYELGLPGLDPSVIDSVTKKSVMRDKWYQAGVTCPEYIITSSPNEIRDAITKIGLPVILKPGEGMGGASRGIVVIEEHSEIEEAIEFSLSFYDSKITIVEKFISAVSEHSAEVLVSEEGSQILTIGDKNKSHLPYRVDLDVRYPTKIDENILVKVYEGIKKSISALGINIGAVHIEFCIDNKGDIYFFELGARCGGGATAHPIVSYVTGVDYFIKLIELLSGENISLAPHSEQKGCCYHFINSKKGVLHSCVPIAELELEKEILDIALFPEVGDIVGEIKTGLDRLGFIVAGGTSNDDAYDRAIRFEKYLNIHIK